MFYNSESTMTLCHHDWARKAGYQGKPVTIYLKGLARRYERVDNMEYEVLLLDTAGRQVSVHGVGLDVLTQEVRGRDPTRAYQ